MDSLADLDRAIGIDSRYTAALVSRGKVYQVRGDDEAARTDFDLALTIDPERARIWVWTGISREKREQVPSAVAENRALFRRGQPASPRA